MSSCYYAPEQPSGGVLRERVKISTTSAGFKSIPTHESQVQVYNLAAGVSEWSYTGRLLEDLSGLQADGGLPGGSLEERVTKTILLALQVRLEAGNLPGVYDRHIEKMTQFIQANETALNMPIVKALAVIQGTTSCKVPAKRIQVLFGAPPSDVLAYLQQSL